MRRKPQNEEQNNFNHCFENTQTTNVQWMNKVEFVSLFTYIFPCILSVFCYSNSLHGNFVHDDLFAIVNNPDVTGQNPISAAFHHDFWGKRMDDIKSHKSYRPLTTLLFRLDFYLSLGNSTWFHVVNVALHSCVTFTVTLVCMHVLHTTNLCALMAASLFAVHPIHTEAVSGIVGRADVLAALLFMLAFYLYSKCLDLSESHSKHADFNVTRVFTSTHFLMTSSVLLTVVATLCKETGVMALAVCFLYDVAKNRLDIIRCVANGKLSGSLVPTLVRLTTLSVVGICLMLFRVAIMNFQLPNFKEEDNPASFSDSFITRILTFNYLLPFNLWLLFCPVILCYDWQNESIPLVTSFADHRNVFTLVFYVMTFQVARKCLKELKIDVSKESAAVKQKHPVPVHVSAILLLCLPFLPASNLLFRVGFVVAERVLYIPSIGFCILISHGALTLCSRMPSAKGHIQFLFLLLLMALSARTYQRNKVWMSRQALFRSGVQTVPYNAKVHYNMANFLKDIGNFEEAKIHYERSIQLNPSHASYHNNMGTVLTNQSEAEFHFREALRLHPSHKGAMVNLGNLLIERGNYTGLDLLYQAIDIDPVYINAILSLGKALVSKDNYLEAQTYARQAMALRPDMAESHTLNGVILQKTGQFEEAVHEYKQAFSLNSHNTDLLKKAALSLRMLKRYSEAELLLKQAISMNLDSGSCLQLGNLYAEMGHKIDALFAFREALVMAPNDTIVNLKYIQALIDTNQLGDAQSSLLRLLQKEPHDLDVLRFAYTFAQQQHRPNEAQRYIEQAIERAILTRHPSLGKLYHDLGDVYRQKNQLERSLDMYMQSIEADPSLIESHINIGTIYHIQNKFALAEEFYNRALSLHPTDQLAASNLKKLKNVWKNPNTT